jgi:hypothetical protein
LIAEACRGRKTKGAKARARNRTKGRKKKQRDREMEKGTRTHLGGSCVGPIQSAAEKKKKKKKKKKKAWLWRKQSFLSAMNCKIKMRAFF